MLLAILNCMTITRYVATASIMESSRYKSRLRNPNRVNLNLRRATCCEKRSSSDIFPGSVWNLRSSVRSTMEVCAILLLGEWHATVMHSSLAICSTDHIILLVHTTKLEALIPMLPASAEPYKKHSPKYDEIVVPTKVLSKLNNICSSYVDLKNKTAPKNISWMLL